ncbi:MAG: Maf family nucleotide pyrophosphatase [Halieaceae bacterium]|jgi:MAF protein|nr:Maf family nucleotide pyrophosphatase [Halieaceae bacterium]
MDVILASSSPYRQRLLARLQIPFRCLAPDVDETRLPNEPPAAMAARLALAKARSVASSHPDALVIGSDQVAALGNTVMGKPGGYDAAFAQLRSSAGREVRFHTGLALHCTASGFERFHVEPYSVYFRELSDKSIRNYLQMEQPYDCAGSFKWEGLGIALFARMAGDDPTSLEGLPLITLTGMLAAAGLPVLSSPRADGP